MSHNEDFDALFADIGEQLARHEGRVDWSRWSEYRHRPVKFIHEVLGNEPWEAQKEICMSVLANDLTTVRSSNGAGKDWIAGRLALWWAYSRQGLAVLTGPTAAQVENILMRGEVFDAFHGAGLPGDLGVRALRPRGEGRAGILARTSTSVSNLQGFHDSQVLYIITEAGAEDARPAWDAVLRVAVGEHDRALAVGNPQNPVGPFYESHQPGSPWNSIHIPAHDIPNVARGKEVIPGAMSRRKLDLIVQQHGPESAEYTRRVEANFPAETRDSVFSRDWIEAAVERHEQKTMERGPAMAGLDVGGSGSNPSVLAVRQGPVLTDLISWQDQDHPTELVHRVKAALKERGFSTDTPIIVDALGVGAKVVRRFRGAGLPGAMKFKGGSRSDYPDSFANGRAQAVWQFRERLRNGEVALPRDEDLAQELLAHRYTTDASERIKILGKREMRADLPGSSPDLADAVVLAFLFPVADPKEAEPQDPVASEPEDPVAADISGNFLTGMRSASPGPGHPRRVSDPNELGWEEL